MSHKNGDFWYSSIVAIYNTYREITNML
jgi:hypothetical protein